MLQNSLDNQAIEMLPRIKTMIENADDFDGNQMRNFTLQKINNLKSLVDMTHVDKDALTEHLILVFKNKNWGGVK